MDLHVESVERIPIEDPLREIPRRNMVRERPHGTQLEICKVRLRNGVIVRDETITFDTRGLYSTCTNSIRIPSGASAHTTCFASGAETGSDTNRTPRSRSRATVPGTSSMRKVSQRTPA